MNKKNKRRISKFFIAIGACFILSAAALVIFNEYQEVMAKTNSQAVLSEIEAEIELNQDQQLGQTSEYEINENLNMPTILIDGNEYIGTIEIAVLDLKLPISSRWSYTQLKTSPCRYSGSVYSNDMVIAGHNYISHFSSLKNLSLGDEVIFTDVEFNEFIYEVVSIEIIEPTEIEEMITADDWDLTLFTCSYGGTVRLAIRCKLV